MISQEVIDIIEGLKDTATKEELEYAKNELDIAWRSRKPFTIDEDHENILFLMSGDIKTANLETVYEASDLTRERFDEVIKDLEKEGTLYSPKRGFIQLT